MERNKKLGAISRAVPSKLVNTSIPINLLSMKLGLVDIVLRMDWLARQTRIFGDKKEVRIKDPKGKTLIARGEKNEFRIDLISGATRIARDIYCLTLTFNGGIIKPSVRVTR